MNDSTLLCLDVGGTKLDYCFIKYSNGTRTCELEGRLFCSEFSSFHDALKWLLEQVSSSVSLVCIAAAGPVYNDSISFTNLDWHINAQKIARNFKLKKVVLVNDLTALMWSLQALTDHDYLPLKYGGISGTTRLVVAPGTGLGVGIAVETATGLVCLPSEGGHVSFSPRNQIECELLAFLDPQTRHISAESVCSGLGLGNIFRFLTKDNPCAESLDYHALGPWLMEQVEVGGAYAELAEQTYAMFYDILAEVCGNLAVTCLPSGGVYLAGGLVSKLAPFLDKERFLMRFLDRTIQKELLDSFSLYRITHKKPALVGCETLMVNS